MADLALAERLPLAHCVVPGRHGRSVGEAGVTLTVRTRLMLVALLARQSSIDDLRRAAANAGLALPDPGRFLSKNDCAILWSGPGQWLVAAEPRAHGTAEQFRAVCAPFCAVVDQSDAKAVIEITGPQARAVLAKSFPIDLHPRAFEPGSTALTVAAAVPAQIWQTDATPTFRVAVPLSYSEGFWHGLTHAAAEFGVAVAQ